MNDLAKWVQGAQRSHTAYEEGCQCRVCQQRDLTERDPLPPDFRLELRILQAGLRGERSRCSGRQNCCMCTECSAPLPRARGCSCDPPSEGHCWKCGKEAA